MAQTWWGYRVKKITFLKNNISTELTLNVFAIFKMPKEFVKEKQTIRGDVVQYKSGYRGEYNIEGWVKDYDDLKKLHQELLDNLNFSLIDGEMEIYNVRLVLKESEQKGLSFLVKLNGKDAELKSPSS